MLKVDIFRIFCQWKPEKRSADRNAPVVGEVDEGFRKEKKPPEALLLCLGWETAGDSPVATGKHGFNDFVASSLGHPHFYI